MAVVFLEWFLYLFLNYSDGSDTGGHGGCGLVKHRMTREEPSAAGPYNLNTMENPTEPFFFFKEFYLSMFATLGIKTEAFKNVIPK